MSRTVVVIADCPPGDRFDPVSLRLGQVAELYRGAGARADLLLARRPGLTVEQVAEARDGFARVAVVERAALTRQDAGTMAGFGAARAWQTAHCIGAAALGCGWGEEAGLAVVRDHGPFPVPRGADTGGIAAATSDIYLGDRLATGRAVRLPYLPATRRYPAPRIGSGMIGWVGPAGPDAARGWEEVLEILARRRGGWPGGILLGGGWVRGLRLPPAIDGLVLRPELHDLDAGLRTLDLAVLPGAPQAGEDVIVAEALRLGTPVLATEGAAAHFGDRWRMPRPGSAEALANMLTEEGLAACPVEAAAETMAEIDRDGAAMTAYFLSRIAGAAVSG